jgi:hypothetical protein
VTRPYRWTEDGLARQRARLKALHADHAFKVARVAAISAGMEAFHARRKAGEARAPSAEKTRHPDAAFLEAAARCRPARAA